VLNPLRKIFRKGEVDCQEVRRVSSDYLEEDLPPQRMSAVHSHLSNCGPCKAFVDTLSSTIGMLKRLPRVSAPDSFKQSVMERIRRER